MGSAPVSLSLINMVCPVLNCQKSVIFNQTNVLKLCKKVINWMRRQICIETVESVETPSFWIDNQLFLKVKSARPFFLNMLYLTDSPLTINPVKNKELHTWTLAQTSYKVNNPGRFWQISNFGKQEWLILMSNERFYFWQTKLFINLIFRTYSIRSSIVINTVMIVIVQWKMVMLMVHSDHLTKCRVPILPYRSSAPCHACPCVLKKGAA